MRRLPALQRDLRGQKLADEPRILREVAERLSDVRFEF